MVSEPANPGGYRVKATAAAGTSRWIHWEFSHSGIQVIRERCSNNKNGLIFIQEKAKEEDREKLGEKEETIPPDYRLEEAKVNRPGSFFLTYFHSY